MCAHVNCVKKKKKKKKKFVINEQIQDFQNFPRNRSIHIQEVTHLPSTPLLSAF